MPLIPNGQGQEVETSLVRRFFASYTSRSANARAGFCPSIIRSVSSIVRSSPQSCSILQAVFCGYHWLVSAQLFYEQSLVKDGDILSMPREHPNTDINPVTGPYIIDLLNLNEIT